MLSLIAVSMLCAFSHGTAAQTSVLICSFSSSLSTGPYSPVGGIVRRKPPSCPCPLCPLVQGRGGVGGCLHWEGAGGVPPRMNVDVRAVYIYIIYIYEKLQLEIDCPLLPLPQLPHIHTHIALQYCPHPRTTPLFYTAPLPPLGSQPAPQIKSAI